MNGEPEILSAEEDLRRKMAINESQLSHLYALAKADNLNFWILSFVEALLILAFFFFLGAFLFERSYLLIRSEVLEFSGVICVLLVIGIWEIAKALFSTQMRVQEIKMLIEQQKNALAFAKNILRTSSE
jgi:hypothetical protein